MRMTQEQQAIYEQAKRLKQRKQFQEALNLLEEKLNNEDELNDPSLHYLEGECFEGIGNLEIACLAFRNAYLATIGWRL